MFWFKKISKNNLHFLYNKVFEKRLKLLGEDHASTISAQNNLALSVFKITNYKLVFVIGIDIKLFWFKKNSKNNLHSFNK